MTDYEKLLSKFKKLEEDFDNLWLEYQKRINEIVEIERCVIIYIEDVVGLIKDHKINIEIKERESGASFGIYNIKYVPVELLRKRIVAINVQYVDGKRLLILEF